MACLGVDLGGTSIRVGLVENDMVADVESMPVRKTENAADVVDDISGLIGRFGARAVAGIGIGVPGVVDVEAGIVYDVQNIPSWKEVPIKQLLEERFKIPVYVNNDANCFAVGEQYFGKGKGRKNIVGLTIGTGMGAGIIVEGKLYSGRNCGAGEFGCAPFRNSNYEYYCSGQFFAGEYHTAGEELFIRANRGDEEAKAAFAAYGANLGEAMKLVMYTLDPEIIILGGSVSRAYDLFKGEMLRAIDSFSYHRSVENLVIEVSDLNNSAVLGAAALYYDSLQR